MVLRRLNLCERVLQTAKCSQWGCDWWTIVLFSFNSVSRPRLDWAVSEKRKKHRSIEPPHGIMNHFYRTQSFIIFKPVSSAFFSGIIRSMPVEVVWRQSNICIKYELGSTVAFASKHIMCEKVVISSQLYTIVHFKKRVNVNTNIRETKHKIQF